MPFYFINLLLTSLLYISILLPITFPSKKANKKTREKLKKIQKKFSFSKKKYRFFFVGPPSPATVNATFVGTFFVYRVEAFSRFGCRRVASGQHHTQCNAALFFSSTVHKTEHALQVQCSANPVHSDSTRVQCTRLNTHFKYNNIDLTRI